jgi:hypothetical protein
MFYSRKLNRETGRVEVWECEWSNPGTGMAKKEFIRKYCDEGGCSSDRPGDNSMHSGCVPPRFRCHLTP